MKSRASLNLCLSAVLLFLSSCSVRQPRSVSKEAWHQAQVRLYDIPLLVNAEPYSEYKGAQETGDTTVFAYKAVAQPQMVITFYQQEMERNGWKELNYVTGYESLVAFQKPSRTCFVSIRPLKEGSSGQLPQLAIIIFITKKL